LDAAACFGWRLSRTRGARLHAIGDEGVPVREIAGAIGRHLTLPVTGIAPETAFDHFGWLGGFLLAGRRGVEYAHHELLGGNQRMRDSVGTESGRGHHPMFSRRTWWAKRDVGLWAVRSRCGSQAATAHTGQRPAAPESPTPDEPL